MEALIAISILMIAVASTMSISQRSLTSSILSRDQMTASFLAQDGLEAVKNIRDAIAINTPPGPNSKAGWLTGSGDLSLTKCICTTGNCDFGKVGNTQNFDYCTIDTTTNPSPTVNNSSGSIPPLLTASDSSNPDLFTKYDYTDGTPSIFYRVINIQVPVITSGPYSNQYEAKVNVRVFWNSNLGPQSVDISDFLYAY